MLNTRGPWALRSMLALATSCAVALISVNGSAMMCTQPPLNESIGQADAILSGTIAAVRYLPAEVDELFCWHNQVGREKCGAKVVEVTVEKVWKGEVESSVFVFSEDACYCLGTYVSNGDKKVFFLKKYVGDMHGADRIDYRTALCAPTRPLAGALKDGLIDALDERFDAGMFAYKRGDYETAFAAFKRSAERGDADAQFNLGAMYHFGQGVPQDQAEAANWYQEAAERGHVGAQATLGVFYQSGRGVPRDLVISQMWFTIAAMQGDELAEGAAQFNAVLLSSSQIDHARRLAREWLEGHGQ